MNHQRIKRCKTKKEYEWYLAQCKMQREMELFWRSKRKCKTWACGFTKKGVVYPVKRSDI